MPYQSCSRMMPWHTWREAELYTVEGYVFQESSIKPSISTLEQQGGKVLSLQPETGLPTGTEVGVSASLTFAPKTDTQATLYQPFSKLPPP